ncbi:hypothetical protein [Streptomyces sp. NPDC051992]|uniref:hypothetical protein n=1 Tax=Streptomyces sp. NPDC051992 TaxID=3161012 RepID=UPI0034470800
MNAGLPEHTRDTAARLGTGVLHALKVLAGQLADAPTWADHRTYATRVVTGLVAPPV